ncbi:MAG: hypothetical protein JWP87_1499 [Labilithrix sp.]|nr:hypothetical protein [Labilithrix sp.]
MRTPFVLALAIASVALATSCDDVKPDEGLDATLRVSGGQFRRGDMPAEETGPAVKDVSLSPIVAPGASDRKCAGVMEGPTTAVALALGGDPGFWIVPAAPPDVTAPGFPTFAASVSFSSAIAPGTRTFIARAVDAEGRFGAPFTRPLDVTPAARPTGRLVIALSWDTQADLDLHVVDPTGVEIWKRNINSYEPPPPGAPPEAPNTPHPGGVLDFDSNAQCVPDGRHAENVAYADKPPSGHYTARVDTYSLCKAAGAHWRVEAFLDGTSVGAAEGSSTEFDTRYSHDRGAGVLALELDVP